ncbi:MAG: radical SAM protein [Armatimonadetes bacterium]|nr:radical SAM protein [Armatimonadota bacterium]
MTYRKVTWNEQEGRVSIYNVGCNFRCIGCSYKLLSPPLDRTVSAARIEELLEMLRPRKVTFLGGEPTTNPAIGRLLRFAKEQIGAETWLGHTNGSHLPLPFLDGANVSLKAYTPEKHLTYTGYPAQPIYDNFRAAFDAGLQMKASAVYIPGFIDLDEIEGMVRFLAALDPGIPFHLMGYVPVPGAPWRRPTDDEMKQAVELARSYLKAVTYSHLTAEEMRNWQQRSKRWASVEVS